MKEAEREFIFLSLFTVKVAKILLLICFCITVLSAFIVPSFPENNFWSSIYNFSSSAIAEVKLRASESKHPLTLAVTYILSMSLSFISALFISFSKLNMSGFNKLLNKRFSYRLLAFLFIILMITLPLFHTLPINKLHFSYNFFRAVSENRAFLALWGGSYLLLLTVLWTWLLFEVSNILRSVR
ncbi:hypothetical protein JQR84_24365 (plasmid) [Pseudomonas luteola]|uniref:hypothetical protein n=1 Tax=Pseudomonas TaxID=286 RepID=UPI003DA17040